MEHHKVFNHSNAKEILRNRFVVVIGDSNLRATYKDLILLLQNDRYLNEWELKTKGEYSFLGDELIEGGRKGQMNNGIRYTEVRQYHTDVHLVRFYFTTRCYNTYFESILRDLKEGPKPDLIIMNSCLWDITRYGKDSIKDYKQNLNTLFTRFTECLPYECLVIWTTTLPISSSARGGFLVPEIQFMSNTLRVDIIEANYLAKTVAVSHGCDVLDLHFYLRHYLQCRVGDGIHWDTLAHRYISNLIFSHVCDAWNIAMPPKRPVTFGSYGAAAGRQQIPKVTNWSGNSQHASNGSYASSNSNSLTGLKGPPSDLWNRSGAFSNYSRDGSNARSLDVRSQANVGGYGSFTNNDPNWNDIWKKVAISNMNSFPLNGAESARWQTYQQSMYQGAAPNRRQQRHNPYNRRH